MLDKAIIFIHLSNSILMVVFLLLWRKEVRQRVLREKTLEAASTLSATDPTQTHLSMKHHSQQDYDNELWRRALYKELDPAATSVLLSNKHHSQQLHDACLDSKDSPELTADYSRIRAEAIEATNNVSAFAPEYVYSDLEPDYSELLSAVKILNRLLQRHHHPDGIPAEEEAGHYSKLVCYTAEVNSLVVAAKAMLNTGARNAT